MPRPKRAAFTAGRLWIGTWKRSRYLCVHCFVAVIMKDFLVVLHRLVQRTSMF